MSKLTITNSLTDGTTANAEEVNTNFQDVVDVVNSLDGDNVNDSASSKIMVTDNADTITGVKTFSTNPIFNNNGILDAYLSTNVALLDGNNTHSGANTFSQAIDGLKVPILGVHPSIAGDNNKIYELSTDGNLYVYKHGTGAVQLDYTDAYTGGAPNTYSGQIVIDESSPAILMVKCETGWSSATLSLIGIDFPSWVYTELPSHTHTSGTLVLASGSVSGTTHTHSTDITHDHPLTQFASTSHTHTETGNHLHAMYLNSNNTDLDDHRHDSGTLVTQGVAGAGISAQSGSTDLDHTHNVIGNTGYTALGSHQHIINGNTAGNTDLVTVGATGSASSSVSSYSGSKTSGNNSAITPTVGTSMSGSTESAGLSGLTLNTVGRKINITTAIKIYITQDISAGWGTAYDSGTYAELLNILGSNGTGSIDITSKLSTGMNYIKIVDETANKGGTLVYHCQTV